MELKKIDEWYVDSIGISIVECSRRDQWCRDTFGGERYYHEFGDGWWLQSKEEHMLFLLTWS